MAAAKGYSCSFFRLLAYPVAYNIDQEFITSFIGLNMCYNSENFKFCIIPDLNSSKEHIIRYFYHILIVLHTVTPHMTKLKNVGHFILSCCYLFIYFPCHSRPDKQSPTAI
jgi:hypothetical protein